MTPWTEAHQAPLSMEFSRKEYWSGLSFPSPRDLPDPGIEYGSPVLQTDSGGLPILQMVAYHLSHQGNPIGKRTLKKKKKIQNDITEKK